MVQGRSHQLSERMKTLFPTILIILDLAAAVVYALAKDYPRAFYWIMAGGITLSTLFIK